MDHDIENTYEGGLGWGDPQDTINKAHNGDTVVYRLRGPASQEECLEVANGLQDTYRERGLKFEVIDGGVVSQARVIRHTHG